MLALRDVIVRERPEIVHAHNWLVHSFLPLKAWSGARLIVTLHNYNLVCAKMTLLYNDTLCAGPGFTKCLGCAAGFYGLAKGIPIFLSNRVMSMAERSAVDMFVAVSQTVVARSGLVGSRLPFQVIPNFIPDDDSTLQDDAKPYLDQLPAGDYLLFVGALGRFKGVDVLLRAYAGLTNAPPLVLIGYQAPEWPMLAGDCPHNVFVLKDWPHYAVMQAWRRSMIAFAPSLVPETFGMAVMEAMSTGRPVIVSRIGALTELVADGETGLLVEPGDSLALQKAIERLLASPDLRRCMGQAALRRVVEFQAKSVVPRIEQVYRALLQS